MAGEGSGGWKKRWKGSRCPRKGARREWLRWVCSEDVCVKGQCEAPGCMGMVTHVKEQTYVEVIGKSPLTAVINRMPIEGKIGYGTRHKQGSQLFST